MLGTFGVPEARAWGVDCSRVQGKIDHKKLAAAGCSWVTHKVSEGANYVDEMWDTNAKAAKDAGLLLDGYHFLTRGSPVADQIKCFASAAFGRIDLPPAVDFESPAPKDWIPPITGDWLTKRALEAVQTVEGIFGPKRVCIYTYPDFAHHLPPSDALVQLVSYDLWIASYHDEKHAPKETDQPSVPAPWVFWKWWQWSGDKGLPAPGINCVVDHDLFNGSDAELRALLLPTSETGPCDDAPITQRSPESRVI